MKPKVLLTYYDIRRLLAGGFLRCEVEGREDVDVDVEIEIQDRSKCQEILEHSDNYKVIVN